MCFGTHTNLYTSGIILEYASFVKYRHLMARIYGLGKFFNENYYSPWRDGVNKVFLILKRRS